MDERRYRNVFLEYGYSQSDIEKRLQEAWANLFEGPEDQRIYFEGPDNTGYFTDTGNNDVRTEGQSYAMMMAVQMDRKDIFDRVWKWTMTHMYMRKGRHEGYFAWSCQTSGKPNADGPAPDGEEYFAMALLFASHRWGDGEGIFEYSKHARELLHRMIHQGETEGRFPMMDPTHKMIRFIAEVEFTDPSYHLPHFYELFAQWGMEEDRDFWLEAARVSRQFLPRACHAETGLNPEYSEFDGTPREWHGEHQYFFSDSYRTIPNIAIDGQWFGTASWHKDVCTRFLNFFADKNPADYRCYEVDGTPLELKALHPVGLIAANAVGALAFDKEQPLPAAEKALRLFWDTPLRSGERRYYDNCLYLFAFMALSGNYRIY